MNPPNWLPLVLALAGLAATVFNTVRLRRSGVNPWVLPSGDGVPGFLSRTFGAVAAIYVTVLCLPVVAPDMSALVGFVPALGHPAFGWFGIALVACGIGLVALAQREMGAAWRVGIADQAPPGLIVTGPFSRCRNPIFLGMLLAGGGIALAMPSALSFAAFTAMFVGLSIHVRLEEGYLTRWLGHDYEAYAAKVPRWLPRLWP